MRNFFSFLRPKNAPKPRQGVSERGFLVFGHTGAVIQAESCLKKAGFAVEVKGPPPSLHTGCDMVVVFPLMEQAGVMHCLHEAALAPEQVVTAQDVLLEPVSLFHSKDFGDYLMVRAANMKITADKRSRIIVNISGGGCPDVPYLAAQLVGQPLDSAPEPRTLGQTLCCYSLQLAFVALREQLCGA